jgi:hypothetical protein
MLSFKTSNLVGVCVAIVAVLSLSCLAAATPKPGHHVGGSGDDPWTAIPSDDAVSQPDMGHAALPSQDRTPDSPFTGNRFWNGPPAFFGFGFDACPGYSSLTFGDLSSEFGAPSQDWGPVLPTLGASLGMLSTSGTLPPQAYFDNQMYLLNPDATYAAWAGPCAAFGGFPGP